MALVASALATTGGDGRGRRDGTVTWTLSRSIPTTQPAVSPIPASTRALRALAKMYLNSSLGYLLAGMSRPWNARWSPTAAVGRRLARAMTGAMTAVVGLCDRSDTVRGASSVRIHSDSRRWNF